MLKLFLLFFKIGLFSFGGGYAMIPLMQKALTEGGLISVERFADIVAVSQMTPGPLAVNAATYIGYTQFGILGSALATLGVALPSFIIILLIARSLERFKENKIVGSVLYGIRPVTIGLMAAAVASFATMSIINPVSAQLVNIGGALIFLVAIFATLRLKLSPIAVVLISAILGLVVM